jgi:hypothetical protein
MFPFAALRLLPAPFSILRRIKNRAKSPTPLEPIPAPIQRETLKLGTEMLFRLVESSKPSRLWKPQDFAVVTTTRLSAALSGMISRVGEGGGAVLATWSLALRGNCCLLKPPLIVATTSKIYLDKPTKQV